MKTRLLHVRANVSDLRRSIAWYESVLGFSVTGTWPPDQPHYAHFDAAEGATFSIQEDAHVPSHGRFNFDVEDVDALFDTPYGTRKFTNKDPDGNELGFVKG